MSDLVGNPKDRFSHVAAQKTCPETAMHVKFLVICGSKEISSKSMLHKPMAL